MAESLSAELPINDLLENPAQFLLMERGLAESGRLSMVSHLITQARSRHAGMALWDATIRQAVAHLIPAFHGGMLRDSQRNAVYRTALETLAPGRTVLDIGTGSGLLAMMAVRAGAKRVYACEANPVLAAAAKEVIAANGMADAIMVFAKSSVELDPKVDLDGGVDLIVSELIADDMLSESLLPSLNDASRRLCQEGGLFLPGKAWVQVALGEYADLPVATSEVEGFDLSLCAQLLPHRVGIRPDNPKLNLRSSSAALFSFDYAPGLIHRPTDSSAASVTCFGGHANVIAQWIGFEFAPGLRYENSPGSAADMHWRIQLTPIPGIMLEEGQSVEIEGLRDQLGMVIGPIRPSSC
ncbi:50S ribosomal protein L11 methyltransferase [Altererythrobacter sp. GH1-8]|uniref:50S ribosomal protein L11 methyltransferase n=1 Tax=Altererythrobacter sp. GH1-8 TaxID=3349333 RepID=UPI00374CC345